MAIHQNRLPRGAGVTMKGYIKEALLPSCMDLVVWGHEHECTIEGGMHGVVESAEVRCPPTHLAGGYREGGRGHRTGWGVGCAAPSAAAGLAPAWSSTGLWSSTSLASVFGEAPRRTCELREASRAHTRGWFARVHRRISSP